MMISQKPPKTSILSDDFVLQMRREVRLGTNKSQREYARQYHTSVPVIFRAMTGRSFRHLDSLEAPVKQDVRKTEMKEKARALYLGGMSLGAIHRELNVSKASLSAWCKDIMRRPEDLPKAPSRGGTRPRKSKFSREDLIADFKAGMKIKDIVEKHKVSRPTIYAACHGVERDKQPVRQGVPRRSHNVPLAQPPYQDYFLYDYYDKTKKEAMVRLVHRDTGKDLRIARARYLMSVHLGRVLTKGERVLHTGPDETCIDHLLLKPIVGDPGPASVSCKICGTQFKLSVANRAYCSETCRAEGLRKKEPKAKKTPATPAQISCVVCEGQFIPTKKGREVCYAQSCIDIIRAGGGTV